MFMYLEKIDQLKTVRFDLSKLSIPQTLKTNPVRIDKHAKKYNRIINCLLQIKIAEEDSKFGMSADEASVLLQSDQFSELKHINVTGLMGMATFTDNMQQIKGEFNFLNSTFNRLKSYHSYNCNLETISMGMSGDYQLAINCGSTMVRVGSSIFGARNYAN